MVRGDTLWRGDTMGWADTLRWGDAISLVGAIPYGWDDTLGWCDTMMLSIYARPDAVHPKVSEGSGVVFCFVIAKCSQRDNQAQALLPRR